MIAGLMLEHIPNTSTLHCGEDNKSRKNGFNGGVHYFLILDRPQRLD